VALYDTCWWAINYRFSGVIYPKREKSTQKKSVLVASRAILWMVYAAFSGFFAFFFHGGQIDFFIIISAAFGLGIFILMNCATFPVDTEWRIWPTAIIDTVWGVVLLGASAKTASLILE
jgi:hypothetical protein